MAEQTFKSPGFFEKEIDLTQRTAQLTGIPAGVVGTAQKGPAFVPVSVGSLSDFIRKFGDLDSEKFGPYAVNEFLKNRSALTYIRVLGAGANSSSTDIATTNAQGTVKNAGFIIKGSGMNSFSGPNSPYTLVGAVQFISAKHQIHEAGLEADAYPIFTDNESLTTSASEVTLIRGMLFLGSGSRAQIMQADEFYNENIEFQVDETFSSQISSYDGTKNEGTFKLVISSSAGARFNTQEGFAGIKIYTASLNYDSDHYIGKVLNTDPDNFRTENHLLYGDFPIEPGLARVKYDGSNDTVCILSGTTTWSDNLGRFDTRYSNAKTTSFISQPFGTKEYDLFHFETLSDGSIANTQVKVSISDLKRSTNPVSQFGTFTVLVRDYYDNDLAPKILEQFPNCTLDPGSENFIAKVIGDYKVYYDFDATSEGERRLKVSGKYPNKSEYIRIIMNSAFDSAGNVPENALPFGFRGIPGLMTNEEGTDTSTMYRLATKTGVTALKSGIIPPIPMTIKATRGKVKESGAFFGDAGNAEVADPRIYWGIKTTTLPLSSSISKAVLMTNGSGDHNPLINSYTKLLGIQKLDVLTTGSASDTFNNNKFTLARVGLYNHGVDAATPSVSGEITGSANDHMINATYIRNAAPDANTYFVSDGSLTQRISFASLIKETDAKYFNRFTSYLKFTNVFYGGFDGVNILDKDSRKMNDRSSSSETGGKAVSGVRSRLNLHSSYTPGLGLENNIVSSYRAGIKILTDEMSSRINILSVPGIRDSFVTNYASDRVRDFSKAIYLMDLENYSDVDGTATRLFDDDTDPPSVRQTSEKFDARGLDNNYVATYFPNVTINDPNNDMLVRVPSSVAALGALGYNDSVAYPWFAPAGFNRGALEFVVNTHSRLTAADRDTLYEARINPIANFPQGGYVIFGQKTLQFAKTALDRVNVRRMLLEVKRLVSKVANNIVFEQNTQSTRNRFISQVTPLLSTIQTQQGIDSFRVVMDASNNTPEDVEQNRLNGRIVLVPTRAVEFIAIDFIITNSGVSFE